MMLAPSRLTINSMDLAQASVSGTFSSSTAVTPGQRLERLDGERMGLIPAEIIPRPDIDDADRDIGGLGHARAATRPQRFPPAVPSRNRRRDNVR